MTDAERLEQMAEKRVSTDRIGVCQQRPCLHCDEAAALRAGAAALRAQEPAAAAGVGLPLDDELVQLAMAIDTGAYPVPASVRVLARDYLRLRSAPALPADDQS